MHAVLEKNIIIFVTTTLSL